jgi:AcrR family transcriptional regulator
MYCKEIVMNRPAHAREIILKAAEALVQKQGAGNLTYDNLVKESGITRGGITYHFPTKDELLRALLERDLQQWDAMEKALRPKLQNERAAGLIASMRAMTQSSDDQKRFIAGMLSAITHDQNLLQPVRDFHEQRYGNMKGNKQDIDCMILELAAAGLFWQDITGCHAFPVAMRKKISARLEALAKDWAK